MNMAPKVNRSLIATTDTTWRVNVLVRARASVLFVVVPERNVLIGTAGDVAYSICADRPALGRALGISLVYPKGPSSVLAASVHTWQHSSVGRSCE